MLFEGENLVVELTTFLKREGECKVNRENSLKRTELLLATQ